MMKHKNLARALAIGMLLVFLMSAFPLSGPARAATNANPILTLRIAITNDTWIGNGAFLNSNFCTNTALIVHANAGAVQRALIQVPVAALPSNAGIISATLDLTAYGSISSASGGLTGALPSTPLDAVRITQSWTCNTVTYNNQPTTGAQFGGMLVSNETATYPQPTPIDITQAVQNWFAGTWANQGFELLFDSDLGTCCNQDFRVRSAESTVGGTPFVLVQYQLPTATIYPAYYCTGGPCETGILSGSGLPPTLFNITYAENNGTFRRAPRPDLLLTNLSTYYTLRVSDFFGNFLYNASKVVTSTTFVWIVAIPYGIFQVYSMRDTFTSLSIKPAGGTAMLIDIPPRAWWALPLKSQVAYWLNFTLLDANLAAITTINIIRTMGTKLSFIVNGTTLSQVSMNQNGNWETTNLTRGSTYAIGNIMSAPHGIDLFQNYWTLHAWGLPIPVTLWLISVIILGISWGGWGFTYRGKLGRRIHRWPRKAKLISGFILIPLSSTLLVAFIVHLAGGSVFIPIPWAPITSLIPGLSFVVPVDTDPDDPGDGGGDGDGDGKGDPHDVKGPDIYVRVLHEDDDIVRLLVTLTQGARAQFRERGVDWLEDVIRNGVRRSFADHPLHRPFRRTGHVDPRPPGEHGGNGEGRGFDR